MNGWWRRAAGGGVLWLVGDCLKQDDANHKLAPLAQFSRARLGGAEIQRAALGKGLVIKTAGDLAGADYHRLGELVLAKAAAQRPLHLMDSDGKPANGVEFRTVDWQGTRLAYFINMNKGPVAVALAGKAAASRRICAPASSGRCRSRCSHWRSSSGGWPVRGVSSPSGGNPDGQTRMNP